MPMTIPVAPERWPVTEGPMAVRGTSEIGTRNQVWIFAIFCNFIRSSSNLLAFFSPFVFIFSLSSPPSPFLLFYLLCSSSFFFSFLPTFPLSLYPSFVSTCFLFLLTFLIPQILFFPAVYLVLWWVPDQEGERNLDLLLLLLYIQGDKQVNWLWQHGVTSAVITNNSDQRTQSWIISEGCPKEEMSKLGPEDRWVRQEKQRVLQAQEVNDVGRDPDIWVLCDCGFGHISARVSNVVRKIQWLG